MTKGGAAKAGAVLITGGAGFVGCNLADRLLAEGRRVIVYDSLRRARVAENLAWLEARHGARLAVEIADVRDHAKLARAMRHADQVFHLAAQVAVTTSLADPVEDFEINARGTLGVLEAARAAPRPPGLVFASTNKVYGRLGGIPVAADATRYRPADVRLAASGVGEGQPLELYSPYGCSKGAADQYVLDYARVFGVPAVVFRMSCLYGPRQFGTEDQGWVAHFLISALADRPLTIFGDGRQVRDVLYVADVVEAFVRAQATMDRIAGRAFNIGGGPANAVSLRELLAIIERQLGRKPRVAFADWRPGDQAWYVSDSAAFAAATGWRPTVGVEDGVARLTRWLAAEAGTAAARPAKAVA